MFYRAKITMDEMRMHDLPPGFRITPGMPVTADVKVGQRTMIQYLMSRVIPVATESLREP
jgi:HlyD family secretion protein